MLNLLFNSYIFVLLFLPLSIVGYFAINKLSLTWGKTWLLGMSLWFYAYFNIVYLPIIIISILVNYCINLLIRNTRENIRFRKLYLITAVILNIGALFYYKYYDFFISNINIAFRSDFNLHHLILPLGISFFTFQQIGYIIDGYNGEVPDYGFLDYALFVTFFPQLIAGPIVTHAEMIQQFDDPTKKRLDPINFAPGLMAFSAGLAKKVLLADTFGNAVNMGYANLNALHSTDSVLLILFYTFQIYFDFSGYCDMAVGIGLMFNIKMPINFNSPYKAMTISDFWKRWHMTLTRFFTRYVYIPLGGNRKGKPRAYLNVFIVFLVSGLWHGANWTFVLWGALHGVLTIVDRIFAKLIGRVAAPVKWFITFAFVNLLWVFFRANTLSDALTLIGNIISFKFSDIRKSSLALPFNLPEFYVPCEFLFNVNIRTAYPYVCMILFIITAFFVVVAPRNVSEKVGRFKASGISAAVSAILIIWCVLSFPQISTFLYYNF